MRLACVKRAASVDSEPGSNSRLNRLGQPTFTLRTPLRDRSSFYRSSPMFLIALILNSSTDDYFMDSDRSRSESRPTRFSKICAPQTRSYERACIAGLESRLRQVVLTTGLPTSKLFAFQRVTEYRSARADPSRGHMGDLKELLQKELLQTALPYSLLPTARSE